jgi:hypothetical protein
MLADEAQGAIDKAKAERREADLALTKKANEQEAAFKAALFAVEKELVAVLADADEKRLKAVQPELIAAIEGLGNKTALAELAKHLPPASAKTLPDVLTQGLPGLAHLFKGSSFESGLKALLRPDADAKKV